MIVGELLIVSGIVMLFSFPDVLKLDMTQNIFMRAIGIFVFGCGTTVSYYSKKNKKCNYYLEVKGSAGGCVFVSKE